MEEMITAGQTLQAAEIDATGIRVLTNGRQRDTDRAARTDMIKVCFTLLENRIATTGAKTLHLQVVNGNNQVLMGEQSDMSSLSGNPISATRTVDYNGERIEACIFFIPVTELNVGLYGINIIEGDLVIGEAQLILN